MIRVVLDVRSFRRSVCLKTLTKHLRLNPKTEPVLLRLLDLVTRSFVHLSCPGLWFPTSILTT